MDDPPRISATRGVTQPANCTIVVYWTKDRQFRNFLSSSRQEPNQTIGVSVNPLGLGNLGLAPILYVNVTSDGCFVQQLVEAPFLIFASAPAAP